MSPDKKKSGLRRSIYPFGEEPAMVKGVQHECHNEEGSQSGHCRHHLDNQEEDQTLLTSQEVVTAVGITSKYDNTCLNDHSDQSDDQGIKVPCAVQGFCKESFEVIKTKVDIAVEFKGHNVTSLEG